MYVTTEAHHCGVKAGLLKTVEAYARVHGRRLNLKAGATLFYDGEEAGCLFLVVDGALRVSKYLHDGRRQILSFAFPGDVPGLTAHEVFRNDCEAIGEAVVLAIPRKQAFRVLQGSPDLLGATLGLSLAECREMQEHFLMLGQKSSLERLASFLMALAERIGARDRGGVCFDLPMTRNDIGDFLGLTMESVSRGMSKLRAMGAISLPVPSRVCIIDHPLLDMISGARADARLH